ncbi:MAG: hypothetical protein ACK5NF_03595 [Bacilli bacterium]
MKKNNNLIIGIIIAIALFIFNYFELITINLRYDGFRTIVMFAIFLILLIRYLKKHGLGTLSGGFQSTNIPTRTMMNLKSWKIFRIFIIVILLNSLIAFLSGPVFFASSYAKLIGDIETKEFSSDFSTPKLDSLPIVDTKYAKLLGDKKLGSTSGLGSEFHVGEYTDIVYNDEFYIAAPLEYNGFFKWFNNRKSGTPGYILINKSTSKVELVTALNGKDISLKYVDSAYLNTDLHRKAYFGGGWNNEITKPFFELDEEGMPYFVYPKTKKTIGISGGDDVYQTVVVNAVNGEVNVYNLGEQPKWVDNVYSSNLISQQLNYYGKYQNGFINSILGQKGLLRTTDGNRHIYNKDDLAVYTGMTSIGTDESTVGMAFVDVTNKNAKMYSLTGATEDAAKKSAEGKVQNLGYTASFPIPININGEGAYFITLKDAEGLIKQYAFVNVNDYSIVENAVTITEAYSNYVDKMGYDNVENTDSIAELDAEVVRINDEIVNGDSVYVLLVKIDGENHLYTWKKPNSEMVLTNVGDKVKIKVNEDKIISFDNLEIE